MKNEALNNLRKWISLVIAIIIYYLIHEGSHFVCSLIFGVYEKIKFLGLGIQIVINNALISDFKLAIFCIVGSVFTTFFAYILTFLTKKIIKLKSKYLISVGYYTTLALLVIDPIYLSFLYKFFGGGDMNGIILLNIPEIFIQVIYGIVLIINLVVFITYVYPKYKAVYNK